MAVKTAVATHAEYPVHLHMTDFEASVLEEAVAGFILVTPSNEQMLAAIEIRDALKEVL